MKIVRNLRLETQVDKELAREYRILGGKTNKVFVCGKKTYSSRLEMDNDVNNKDTTYCIVETFPASKYETKKFNNDKKSNKI